MSDLRQSTASQEISLGQFLDSTDGDTEENALTIANTDIKIRKHGTTTLVNKTSGGATNISNGVYHATLDATDTNTAGMLEIYVHVAGALATKTVFNVLTATAFDAKYTGTFNNLGGTAQTADHTAAIADIPSNSEFNARTLPSADYFIVSDYTDPDNVGIAAILVNTSIDLPAQITALVVPPSVAQFDARTLVSADYFIVTDYTAPDNASITSILADTNELQLNQGNWLTATGFSTSAEIAALNDISVTDIFAGGDVDTYSLEESLKLMLSANVGILSGAATNSILIKAADGSKTRLTATVDVDGNRSAVTKDATG